MDLTKLIIRQAESKDAAGLAAVYAGPNAIAGTLQLPWPSSELWSERIAKPPAGATHLIAVLDDEVVGSIGLILSQNVRRRHVADIGMGVKDAFQGQGVGSQLMSSVIDLADNWHNIHRLELSVNADNVAAIALYKKFGFVEEGLARDYAFRNGAYVDALNMARIKSLS